MIKKFFKAMFLGLRELELLKVLAKCYFAILWCPLLVFVIFQHPSINLGDKEPIIVMLSIFIGPYIYFYISHCVDALKYQEKQKCSFHDAWMATTNDDSFDEC